MPTDTELASATKMPLNEIEKLVVIIHDVWPTVSNDQQMTLMLKQLFIQRIINDDLPHELGDAIASFRMECYDKNFKPRDIPTFCRGIHWLRQIVKPVLTNADALSLVSNLMENPGLEYDSERAKHLCITYLVGMISCFRTRPRGDFSRWWPEDEMMMFVLRQLDR